jgi:hypothetical protein
VPSINNWFTDGFDTVDLKDAKVLLEELSVNLPEVEVEFCRIALARASPLLL